MQLSAVVSLDHLPVACGVLCVATECSRVARRKTCGNTCEALWAVGQGGRANQVSLEHLWTAAHWIREPRHGPRPAFRDSPRQLIRLGFLCCGLSCCAPQPPVFAVTLFVCVCVCVCVCQPNHSDVIPRQAVGRVATAPDPRHQRQLLFLSPTRERAPLAATSRSVLCQSVAAAV